MPDNKDDKLDSQDKKSKGGKGRKGIKPKLGFDPLSRDDIDALASEDLPPGTPADQDSTGINALIRDTDTHDAAPASAPPISEAGADTQSHEMAMATDMPEDNNMDMEINNEAETPDEPETQDNQALEDEAPQDTTEDEGPDMPDSSAADEAETPDEPETQDNQALEDEAPQDTTEDEGPDMPDSSAADEAANEAQPESSSPTATDSSREAHEEATVSILTYFSFKLAQESFAIDIDRVKEVLEYSIPTRVPRTPPHMKGVINLRGSVVPVVDLRMLFGMPEGEKTVDSSVIIVEVLIKEEQSKIGVIVDSVREVTELKEADIEAAPRVGTLINVDFIKGMGKVQVRGNVEFIMILDVDRIFTLEELLGKEA